MSRVAKRVSNAGDVAKPSPANAGDSSSTSSPQRPPAVGVKHKGEAKGPSKPYAIASNMSGPVSIQHIYPLTSRIKRDRSFIRRVG